MISDFSEFDAETWDTQIEKDAKNGKHEAFYKSLERENENEPEIPLIEILDRR